MRVPYELQGRSAGPAGVKVSGRPAGMQSDRRWPTGPADISPAQGCDARAESGNLSRAMAALELPRWIERANPLTPDPAMYGPERSAKRMP